jgi:hypothetical protein
MAGTKDAAGPEDAASVRERAADERDRVFTEREHLADEREDRADERESKADRREALADEREHEADRREAAQSEREQLADERERQLDERLGTLRADPSTLQQRALGNIERSRELLALSGERLNRREAEVKRSRAHSERQQDDVDRASAESERGLADWLPDVGELIGQATALRKRARMAVEAFAIAEERIARVHEDLAVRRPEHRDELRHIAERARVTARKAREAIRPFTD